jgi:hypothetical protein
MVKTVIADADRAGGKNENAFVAGSGMRMAGRALGLACVFLLALTVVRRAGAQGTFQDLDFESGAIVPMNYGDTAEIEAGSALPGWTVYYGKTQQASLCYDNASVGGANVSLLSSAWRGGTPSGMIHGRYCLLLQEGYSGSAQPGDQQPWETVSLAQTAQVPASAMSLSFRASVADLTVSLGGTVLSLNVLNSCQGYDVYECDVSQFASQTSLLEFTAGDPTVYLDDISFSPAPVPEPTALGLFLAGGALLWWRRAAGRNCARVRVRCGVWARCRLNALRKAWRGENTPWGTTPWRHRPLDA